MNKYQEALNYFLDRDEGDNITVTCDWLSYAEELQELVDKETPMKLTFKRDIYYIECSKCGNPNLNTKWTYGNYCSGCGQRIDWSEDE